MDLLEKASSSSNTAASPFSYVHNVSILIVMAAEEAEAAITAKNNFSPANGCASTATLNEDGL